VKEQWLLKIVATSAEAGIPVKHQTMKPVKKKLTTTTESFLDGVKIGETSDRVLFEQTPCVAKVSKY
jgi:hypothetical protein